MSFNVKAICNFAAVSDFTVIFSLKFKSFLITVGFHKFAPCLLVNFIVFNKLYKSKELFQWYCEKCRLNIRRGVTDVWNFFEKIFERGESL